MPTLRKYLNNIFTPDEVRSLILLEIVLGIVFSFFYLFLYRYITEAVLGNETIIADSFVSAFIISFRSSWLTFIMHILSLLGSEAIILGSIIFVIFLTYRRHFRESFIFSILLLMGALLTTLLKLLYHVPRPFFSAIDYENTYSYPSGHALNSMLFYGAISYFIYHFTKKRNTSTIMSGLTALLILMIGVSRIYLGVHRPSEIVAGFIVGFWLLVTTILIDKTIIYFRFMRESPKK